MAWDGTDTHIRWIFWYNHIFSQDSTPLGPCLYCTCVKFVVDWLNDTGVKRVQSLTHTHTHILYTYTYTLRLRLTLEIVFFGCFSGEAICFHHAVRLDVLENVFHLLFWSACGMPPPLPPPVKKSFDCFRCSHLTCELKSEREEINTTFPLYFVHSELN